MQTIFRMPFKLVLISTCPFQILQKLKIC
uniref:Uncharacterized protein n=1 Tax=Romanomermis culicivorax TaxID=13658 RepID=A0A915HGG6_ROMCU